MVGGQGSDRGMTVVDAVLGFIQVACLLAALAAVWVWAVRS